MNEFDPKCTGPFAEPLVSGQTSEGDVHNESESTPHSAPVAVQGGTAAERKFERRYFIAVDLGGTNIKSGIVSETGELISHVSDPTPAREGGAAILNEIKRIVQERLTETRHKDLHVAAIGVATAGWVKSATGRIIYAAGNLPGWTGTELGDELRKDFALPVAVENDANAMAMAEHRFGAARGVGDFVCITLGTGVGCGVYSGGRLRRGAHDLSNNLAHMQIESDGLQCNCGRRGCFEVYANAAALLRYAGKSFASAKDVIQAANAGNETAREAVSLLARRLTIGLGILIELADPSLVLVGGGVAQDNPLLLARLRENLNNSLLAPDIRNLRIEVSPHSYLGGVVGAAAAALEKLS
ncbi:MAG: ROK family protein [Pyrinomonadaceae bacterium]